MNRRNHRSVRDDPRTLAAEILAYDGFGYSVITRATGLTMGQTSYRLRLLNVSPMDWRRGTSRAARTKINSICSKLK